MTGTNDIIVFSRDGEKVLGVVIEHYTNPLDDFFLVYSNYTLYKSHTPDKDADVIIDNIIIPACDAALCDYRLKRQHLKDMSAKHKEITDIMDAVSSKMETDSIFDEDKI